MRKLLVGLVAVALVLAGVLMALATPPHCPVSRAASERVEPGMTQGQVHAALGVPPGDYRTGSRRPPIC
jgi:outer membrane protein assembly factor BamE (lipoprotein component of BamABCDE complex)